MGTETDVESERETSEMEMIQTDESGAPRQENVEATAVVVSNSDTKRQRDDDEEEEEEEEEEIRLIAEHETYRDFWLGVTGGFFGDFEAETAVPSMRFTDGGLTDFAEPEEALQIFSVTVTEIKERVFDWPLDVFGFIAVRDTVDHNRNYIFNRKRENYQTLTVQDSSLVLTGPSRAIVLCDPITFEIELRVKGKIKSEDKVLSLLAAEYNCISNRCLAGSVRSSTKIHKRSTLEFKFVHLVDAVEATVNVHIIGDPIDFSGRFVARTDKVHEDVVLLDSRDGTVCIDADGAIKFSRSVVVVEVQGELTLGVRARQRNKHNINNESNVAEHRVVFFPERAGRTYGTFDVGFCKMFIQVAWSLLAIV